MQTPAPESPSRKALATIATGPAVELLALAFPTFADYATRHGYDLVVGPGDDHDRPASWGKVPLLRRLLQTYGFVVWLDADTVILDPTEDLARFVPSKAFQALVVARRQNDVVPLAGVWALRSGAASEQFLAEIWAQSDLIDHRLWEQAALMRVMGWTTELPFAKVESTKWDDGTFVLDERWNMVPQHPIGYASGKIRHYPAWTYRRRKFDMGTDLAHLRGSLVRYSIGLLERRWRTVYRPLIGEVRHQGNRVFGHLGRSSGGV